MGKVKVLTDSTSDLSPAQIQENDITVVPLHVTFGEETYTDGIDLSPEEIFAKVEEYGTLPKTAAPTPGEFKKVFDPIIEEGYDIIYVGLSSHLSSTFQNAVIAAQDYPEGRIEVVDSYNLSTGIGLSVMKAVDYARQGLGNKEIAEKIKNHIPKVKTDFVIDTLDYLYKGGRCSSMQAIIGNMFRIRPIIKVVEGKMIVGEKVRGRRERALKTMLDNALKDKDIIDRARVFVTHAGGLEDAKYLKEKLEEALDVEEVIITNAGCVISSHCGPNTVGILYITQ